MHQALRPRLIFTHRGVEIFALVDINNAYVSWERSLRPSLNGRPCVVLSNNDGCCIARSNEARALGIKMGQPWHEVKHFEHTAGLVALSANFTLYGDLSERVMSVIGSFVPSMAVYSIDEAFVSLRGLRGSRVELGFQIRERLQTWLGVPACVGIGPTKTLAKLANAIAKSAERKPGSYPPELAQVCDLAVASPAQLQALFEATPVDEVWGVGRRIGAQLVSEGVQTVADLVRIDPAAIRRRFSIVMEKTVRELQGVSCLPLDDAPAAKQQIMVSRSFGKAVTSVRDLEEAITEFASRGAEKLRRQEHAAGAVMVFIATSPFRTADRQYSRSVTVPLVRPSADTTLLVGSALTGLHAIFRDGFNYAKGGVMLVELQAQELHQGELDLFTGQREGFDVGADKGRLMTAVDTLNQRYGRGAVTMASAGLAGDRRTWSMRQERRTPHYTTLWSDLPIARA